MADVGDGNDKAEAAAAERFAIDRVVEVACGFAVDRHQRQVADVLAPGQVLLQYFLRQCFGLLLHIRREHVGQIVLPECDLDFHAGAGETAEDFDDAADGFVVRPRLGENFHRHHLARLRAARVLGRDENVLVDAAVFRDQETDAAFQVVAPDDGLVDVLQHLDDLALAAAALVEAGDAHQHAVAVQHTVHFLGRQEEVVAAFFRTDETESVRVAIDPALDEIELVRQAELTLAVEHELAVALHRAEPPLEEVVFGLGDVQLRGERVDIDRATGLGQQLQDVFAAGQRRFVAFDLAFIERIGQPDGRDFVLAAASAALLR